MTYVKKEKYSTFLEPHNQDKITEESNSQIAQVLKLVNMNYKITILNKYMDLQEQSMNKQIGDVSREKKTPRIQKFQDLQYKIVITQN